MFARSKASVTGRHHGSTPGRYGVSGWLSRRRACRAHGRSGKCTPTGAMSGSLSYLPMCADSPDCPVTLVRAGDRRNRESTLGARRTCGRSRSPIASGAPGRGAAAETTSGLATKRAPSLSARLAATDLAWPDTPPAAGRAWVPGCRARTLRRPYHRSTTKSPD